MLTLFQTGQKISNISKNNMLIMKTIYSQNKINFKNNRKNNQKVNYRK